ncbi:MAG: hypothetical protein ACRD3D_04710 [Terriglobia bacterium]
MTSRRLCAFVAFLALVFSTVRVADAQNAAPQPNRLLTAKLIYVEPMPGQLDRWIVEDLKAWGKYRIAQSEQGVDIVMRAQKPLPRSLYGERTRPPVIRRERQRLPVVSLTVVDWVTGARLWQADVVNSAPKNKNNEKTPSGPETELRVRHLTPDQIATRAVDLLRQYVEGLEGAPAAKH